MPRQGRSGGGGARSRPSVAPPARNAPMKQQTRPASTAALPPANRTAGPPGAPTQAQGQSQGPGLFGQMASTAAGVAVGSSIGHAIGGFFGGGSSAPAEQKDNSMAAQSQSQEQNSWGARSCEADSKQFTKCLDDHQGNMQICNWYLEQLKACQAAASRY